MFEVKYPEVTVQLTGQDGNAFAIMGAVRKALWKEVGHEAAETYWSEAMASESYDALLQHAMRMVNVE